MISKPQTPPLRIAGFNEDWVQKKLVDEVIFFSGLTYTPSDVVDKSGTLVLRSSNVQNGAIALGDNVYVKSEVVNSQNVEVGDSIVVVRNGSRNLIGKHAMITKPMDNTVIGAFMTGIRAPVPSFFNTLLDTQEFHDEVSKNLGATINQITGGMFKAMSFYLPESDEQTAIGNLFQTIDKTIALQRRKHQQTQTLKKSLLSKMFPKKGQKQPEIRLEGFSGDWVEVKLEDIVEIVGGGTPDTNNPHFWNGDIDWYSPTEIGKKVYADKSVKTITELGLLKSSAQILPANETVLFTSRAGIGDMAILRKDGATNQGFQSFIAKDIDVYFLYSMGSILKEKAMKKASGSTFLEISKNQLKVIELLIPSNNSEQTAIGQFFKQLDDTISLQAKQLKTLENLKQALLAKMFV
ncbi:restriction endonuclease subunit S [Psychrobacter celer]|uniref:restriction endonuclease subunit S n=1 Tax=Psychrobacter celer TaxID=306572 RepID=UPI003FD006FA